MWEYIMEMINTTITIMLIGLVIWSTYIAIGEIKLMRYAKKQYGTIRKHDIVEFLILLGSVVIALIVLFIKPGLIYSVPSTTILLEVGLITVLFHLSDIQRQNMLRIQLKSRNPIDIIL